MKKFLTAATALSVLLAFTGSASAADPAIVDPGYDWTGFYVGLQGGYGFGKNDWEAHLAPDASSDEDNFDGFVGGGTLGANYQMESIVFGLEADVSFSDLDATSTTSTTFGCADGCVTDLDWFATVRGRVGFALDRTMPYVTGGVAFGDAEGTAIGSPTTHGKDTLTGWTMGAGVEHAFTDNLSAKAEFLYVDLGNLEIPAGCGGECFTEVKFSVVRLGLNYNF